MTSVQRLLSRANMILRNRLYACSYLIFFCSFPIFGTAEEENLKLEMVQVLFRHGARTPLVCEADLITNSSESLYNPWGVAQLTNKGMMQMYEVGKMLRDKYKDFLPDSYRQQDLYAYASGTPRTQSSLYLMLAGLYPPTKQLKWNDDLNWLPIPIHSNPRPLDILIKPRLCPTFGKALHHLLETSEMSKEFEKHHWILQKMREIYWKSFDLHDIFCAYNAIKVHKEMNLPMPIWYTDEIYSALDRAKEFYMEAMSYTDTLRKLNGGPLVRRFTENMNDTHWKVEKRKIYLYSAHDKTLHAFLKAYNFSGLKQPDYGSAVIVEKYRGERNESYVKMLYYADEPKEMRTITLKKCTELCPFADYVEIVKPYLPSDDDMLCLYKNITPEEMERIIDPDLRIAEGKENYII